MAASSRLRHLLEALLAGFATRTNTLTPPAAVLGASKMGRRMTYNFLAFGAIAMSGIDVGGLETVERSAGRRWVANQSFHGVPAAGTEDA